MKTATMATPSTAMTDQASGISKRLHHLLGHTAHHPNTAGQRNQRGRKHGLEEAAEHIVHKPQADWRFELGDGGAQEEVREHHATDPHDDGQHIGAS